MPETLRLMKDNEIFSGQFYVQVIDHLKEVSNSLYHIILPAYDHIDNNHALDNEQSRELKQFNEEINEFFNFTITMMQNRKVKNLDEIVEKRDKLIESINEIIRHRIKILKKKQKGTKVSMTYIEMLTETKNLLLHVVQLIKADMNMTESLSIKKE